MLSINYLSSMIRSWAIARNIVDGATPKDQFIKLMSEYGELCGNIESAYMKENALCGQVVTPEKEKEFCELKDKLTDDIGDNYVVLTIIAAQYKMNIEDIQAPMIEDTYWAATKLGQVYGKLGDAILKCDKEAIKPLIASAIGYLTQTCEEFEMALTICVSEAYKDIKDRKGIMYNGTFLKSTDARYEACCREIGVQP